QNNVIPWSYDANYRFGAGKYRMGISGYFSGGFTTPDKRPGLGTPASGVLPWMSGDRFEVFGGYVEVNKGPALLQAAYWAAHHNARRDPAAVMVLLRDAGVNSRQRARFLADPAADPAEPGNIRTAVTYQVRTWYLRLGYSHESNLGEIAPYLQCDFYENPEIIFNKLYGGDEEVGLSDEGKFTKPTLGIIFRPIPEVALKMDASAHIQTLNGAVGHYSEIRLDVSYLFGH
ncbi:MAG: hypothetical protein KDI06_22815, partial [Calditrichaeota bacterium]|nr:hypothetical protein [Calditrichota bacterium]